MTKSYAQMIDEWVRRDYEAGDLINSARLAEDMGIGMPVCSSHLSRRCEQGHLERVARAYAGDRDALGRRRPYVVYKILSSMFSERFKYKSYRGGGSRPRGTKVNRPKIPVLVVEL